MRMIKKILVAIDGSFSTMNAADYAIQLAEQFDAQFKHVLKSSIEKKLLKHLKIPLLIIPENYTV